MIFKFYFLTVQKNKKYEQIKIFSGVLAARVMGLEVYSCSKETKLFEEQNLLNIVKSRTNIESSFSLIDFPSNNEETERLIFADSTHFFTVYFQLDELEALSFETESEETFDDFIFSYLKFNSVFKRKFFDEYADPEDRYKPFLADGIMSMLVNEHYEFQVGDYIFTYINNDYVLATPSVNLGNIQTIRELMNGNPIQNISDIIDKIPEGTFISDAIDPEVTTRNRNFCACEIKIFLTNCTTATISGNCKNFLGASGSGTLNVGIVNNNATTEIPVIVNLGINGNFSETITITAATTRINAGVVSGCSSGSGDDFDFRNIPFGNFCDMRVARETGWQWAQNSSEALDYIVKKSFSNSRNTIEAEVYSKIWTGTKWENKKRKLSARANEVRRTINCIQLGSPHTKPSTCNNCVRRKATISHGHSNQVGPPAHCDGDVTGDFHKDIFGVSLNASGSIEFECCIR